MKRFTICFLLLVFPSISCGFTSLHDYSQSFYYKTASGDYATQHRSGYKNLYDLDDPVVNCKQEVGPCPIVATVGQYARRDSEIREFKVYVASGTLSTGLTVYLTGQSSRYVAVSRFGIPPQSIYTHSDSLFSVLPESGFSIASLKAGDCTGRNNAGILNIASGSTKVSEGGWLYVRLYQIEGSMRAVAWDNIVEPTQFMAWFRSADWSGFGQGSVDIPPTTTPAPQPTATPNPSGGCLYGCNQNETCINGVCVPNAPDTTPTPGTGGCNELLCTFSGGRCINGVCVKPNVTPSPTPTPVPTIESYQTTVGAMTVKITLTETAEIAVNEQSVKGLKYSTFILTGDNKIVFIPGFCFLEIKSGNAKVFLDSGVVLGKSN